MGNAVIGAEVGDSDGMSDWKWRVFLFIRAADATAENKQAFAEIFANNGSMETIENELRMADSAIHLSTSGSAPAQVFGVNTLVMADMRAALQTFVNGLSLSRWYAVANVELANFAPGELVASNGGAAVEGEVWTWDDALADLYDERGLLVIETAT